MATQRPMDTCNIVDENICYHCGTDEPMNDKLGWLDLHFASGTGWSRRFCSSMCLNLWSNKSLTLISGPR